MKYAIVGAGRMGRAVAIHLLNDPTTEKIVLVDSSLEMLSSLSSELSQLGFGPNVEIVQDFLEAKMNSTFLKGIDCCVAACGFNQYVRLTKLCVESGTCMVDLGGSRDVVNEQKLLHEQAIQAGVTIVPDCGLAPGMVGILGMHAFNQIQYRKCTNIDVSMRVGGLPMDPGSVKDNPLQYALSWSADGLISEYDIPADELVNGKLMKVEALTNCENVTIQTPWSKTEFEAFVTGGGSSNLPFLLEGRARNVDYKTLRYRGHYAAMQGLKQLGFFAGDRREVLLQALNEKLTLKDNNDIVIVRAGGRGMLGNGKPTIVIFEVFCAKDTKRNLSAMAQTTGFSAGIVAQLIASKKLPKGVVDAEAIIAGDLYIELLRTAGIKVQVTQR